jgi:hypothetical protein
MCGPRRGQRCESQGSTIVEWLACSTLALLISAAPSSSATANPVIWRDTGPVGTKDLYWGPGRPDQAPRPPFVFVKEDRSGTKPKVRVRDANGMLWTAKFASNSRTGTEVHAEIAVSRLMWAIGYFVEEHYFVANGTITGVSGLRRRTSHAIASDGTFSAARFERRPPGISNEGRWDLDDNPFAGSRELSGLKTLVMLVNNWDARLDNTGILRVPVRGGGIEERYILSDLGTAFGRMGNVAGRATRWNLTHYANSDFIRGVVGDTLVFCHGLHGSPPLSVSLEHARWLSALASQLTHAQVRRAFEASGAESREVDGFSSLVMSRIAQLRSAVDGTDAENGEACS